MRLALAREKKGRSIRSRWSRGLASPVATTKGSSLLRSLAVMGRRDDMGDALPQRDAWPTARAST